MPASKFFSIILIIVVALVFISAGIWIGLAMGNRPSGANDAAFSPYSAVYLSTGDVYFGKLEWFPSPHLEDAWYLDRTTDVNGSTEVNVYPFNKVIWGPANVVYFNAQQIIFWTRLAADSAVAQIIENPNAPAPSAPSTGILPQGALQDSTTTSSTASNNISASVTSTTSIK